MASRRWLGYLICMSALGCSKKDFSSQKLPETGAVAGNDAMINPSTGFESRSPDDPARTDDASASDPVMVDGSYLVCFRDRNQDINQPSEGIQAHLGCAFFKDKAGHERAPTNSDAPSIEKAIGIAASAREIPILMKKQVSPQRWQWIGTFQESESIESIRINVSGPQVAQRSAVLPIYDKIPGGIFLTPTETSVGPFLIRLTGSKQCLSGDPTWSYNASTGVSSSSPLSIVDCSVARSFQASAFQKGWAVHTANPNPSPASECLAQYGMNTSLCNRSCLDRADFGRSTSLQLWGCTTSVEAQSVMFSSKNQSLSVSLNGGPIGFSASMLAVVPDSKLALEWELVSLVP